MLRVDKCICRGIPAWPRFVDFAFILQLFVEGSVSVCPKREFLSHAPPAWRTWVLGCCWYEIACEFLASGDNKAGCQFDIVFDQCEFASVSTVWAVATSRHRLAIQKRIPCKAGQSQASALAYREGTCTQIRKLLHPSIVHNSSLCCLFEPQSRLGTLDCGFSHSSQACPEKCGLGRMPYNACSASAAALPVPPAKPIAEGYEWKASNRSDFPS